MEPIGIRAMNDLEKFELEKRRLECEKLRAEIAQVDLAWWKRAGYIGSLVPIVIAIVGFFSAWSTGFFDTQRQNLKNEIENLMLERNRLNSINEELQSRIDDAYLRLKIASGEASYAIGHIQAFDLPLQEARATIDAALDKIPSNVAKSLADIFRDYENIKLISKITKKDLGDLTDTLKKIPASEWAINLRFEPGPNSEEILIAPDQRYYHIEDRRFYNIEELKERLRKD